MSTPDLLSISAYARHRGCTHAAVKRAIDERRIDPVAADADCARNTRPRADVPQLPLASSLPPEEDTDLGTSQVYDMSAARAKREHHEANLADLKERKTAGTLVERLRVEKAAIDAGSLLRASLEQLPGKLSVVLAAETDPAAVRALLTNTLQEILTDLSDNLATLAHDGSQNDQGSSG